MREYTKPDLERICWHRVGEVYPRINQPIMLLFRDGSIVLTPYNGFRGWCPTPVRWSRMPKGPENFQFDPMVVLEDINPVQMAAEAARGLTV